MPQPHKNHLSFISVALKNKEFKGIQRFQSQVKHQSSLEVTASTLLSNVTNALYSGY